MDDREQPMDSATEDPLDLLDDITREVRNRIGLEYLHRVRQGKGGLAPGVGRFAVDIPRLERPTIIFRRDQVYPENREWIDWTIEGELLTSLLFLEPSLSLPASEKARYRALWEGFKTRPRPEEAKRTPFWNRRTQKAKQAQSAANPPPTSAEGEERNTEVLRTNEGEEYHVFDSVSGPVSTVFFCRDPKRDESVAIKFPRGGDESLDRFREEGRVWLGLGNLDLTFVAPLQRVVQVGGLPGLAMPFYHRGNLGKLLQQEGPVEGAHSLVTQLIMGLETLSSAGVVHNSLKPENILLADDGSVRLADFGISQPPTKADPGPRAMGTISYLSPETLSGEVHDAESDELWALGVIAFRLLTGLHPFPGDTLAQKAERTKEGVNKEALEYLPLSDSARNFLAASLAKDPAQRPRSIEEVAALWDRVVWVGEPSEAEQGGGREEDSGEPKVLVNLPFAEAGWNGLFFPERLEAEGKATLRVKLPAHTALQKAGLAYGIRDPRAVLEHLQTGFGSFTDPGSNWGKWSRDELPDDDFWGEEKGLLMERHPGAKTTEQATGLALVAFEALMESGEEEPIISDARAFAMVVAQRRNSRGTTRRLVGEVLACTGDYETAEAILEEVVNLMPREPLPWSALMISKVKRGAPKDELLDLARAATESDLAGQEANIALARLWLFAGDLASAVPFARKAIDDYPEDPENLGRVVGILWNAGETDEALALLDRLQRSAPDAPILAPLFQALGSRLVKWRKKSEAG